MLRGWRGIGGRSWFAMMVALRAIEAVSTMAEALRRVNAASSHERGRDAWGGATVGLTEAVQQKRMESGWWAWGRTLPWEDADDP